mmetsp:Transcript_11177/g.16959  ORF Transcript_11177/g.16959 Transcript_11177/m.16959 type:complete len:326 (-) Transcript_11177:1100-2077(-)
MYPTDLIYEKTFRFSPSASRSDLFEEMGYEGAVFIALTGSLLINIIMIFCENGLSNLTNWVMKRNYTKAWARKLGSGLPESAAYQVLMKILVAGYLELAICSFISILEFSPAKIEKNFKESNNWSDVFDHFVGLSSTFFCLALPLHFYFTISKNQRKLDEEEFSSQHGYMYEDLKLNSTASSLFNCFYMSRRLLLAFILVAGLHYGNLQLLAHVQLSLAYTGYLLGQRPFTDSARNFKEGFNEVCIVLISDLYLVFKANTEKASQEQLGWIYIGVYLTILVVNLWNVGRNIVLQIPKAYSKAKAKVAAWRRQRFEKKWVSRKQTY